MNNKIIESKLNQSDFKQNELDSNNTNIILKNDDENIIQFNSK